MSSPIISLTAGLGYVRIPGASVRMPASATSSLIANWTDPYEQLLIYVAIPFYAGADVGSLRFGNGNFVVDSGTNYQSRTVTLGAGTVTPLVDAPQTSDTMIRLGIATANGRSGWVHVTNFQTRNKVVKATIAIGTTDATTVADAHVSVEGMWANTTDFIKSVQFVLPGAGKLGTGSQFIVFGMNAA